MRPIGWETPNCTSLGEKHFSKSDARFHTADTQVQHWLIERLGFQSPVPGQTTSCHRTGGLIMGCLICPGNHGRYKGDFSSKDFSDDFDISRLEIDLPDA